MKRVLLVGLVLLGVAAVLTFTGHGERPPQSGMVPCRPGGEVACFDFGTGPIP